MQKTLLLLSIFVPCIAADQLSLDSIKREIDQKSNRTDLITLFIGKKMNTRNIATIRIVNHKFPSGGGLIETFCLTPTSLTLSNTELITYCRKNDGLYEINTIYSKAQLTLNEQALHTNNYTISWKESGEGPVEPLYFNGKDIEKIPAGATIKPAKK